MADDDLQEVSLAPLSIRADDYIIQLDATFDGGVLWTNSSIIQFTYEDGAFVLQNSCTLDVSNITACQIARVEFCKVPVVYLHNKTVYTLSFVSQLPELKMVGSKIDRYIPGDSSSSGDTASYYLQGN